jgi:RHS repeat-associated protein
MDDKSEKKTTALTTNGQTDSGTKNTGGLRIDSLTKENPTKSNAIEIPSVSLPKGGGALKSIDEKFQVNPSNGTAGFSIPLPISPGRQNFSPPLTLSYSSGGGNSPFGLGWELGIPAIQRKTDKQIPRYRDALEEDVFMFSGAEDLVPFLTENAGLWAAAVQQTGDTKIKRYRPRIESGFSKIELISNPAHGQYWKVTTRDNMATIYGRTDQTRISDPEDATKIFKWLPEFSYDNKGNWIAYSYKPDSNTTQAEKDAIPAGLHEANRKNGNAFYNNLYLKRVLYGNHLPYYPDPGLPFDPPAPTDTTHFFELVFDYGEHDPDIPDTAETPGRSWNYRPDPFSTYRSGFEIRTNRLCTRVLMFHLFDELVANSNKAACLIRSLDFTYEPSSINNSGQSELTYLQSLTQCGYIRKTDNSYSKKVLPAMEFRYQSLIWNKEIREISSANLENAPAGLSDNYQWVDLFGEGIAGIFSEQGPGWYYKSNLSNADEIPAPLFLPAIAVAPKPSFTGMNTGVLQLQDLEADGEKQLVVSSPGMNGYFELDDDNDWEPFRAFHSMANVDPHDPFLKSIDLNGDGRPDLIISEENVFVWFASAGKAGYAGSEYAAKAFDEEKGPAIVFSDPLQTIYLADMTGDGLTDIVRIRNGEICYWANKGYGRFSAKINMSHSPFFDLPDQFNPQFLQLGDLSGTGTTDIIYFGQNKFRAWINMSGNSWTAAEEIDFFPEADNLGKLAITDLLGTGTSCLVWSTGLPADSYAPIRYIDLMSGVKPHVMTGYLNNFGKEVALQYKSSTHFYNRDRLDGRPWVTKLAFPVQVVNKVTTRENITNVEFTTEYRYHHGYYDHAEKEFRGFGMVEQLDTENYEQWSLNAAGTSLSLDEMLYQSPVLTKTWFHTGAFQDKDKLLMQYVTEYWYQEMDRAGFGPVNSEPALPDGKIIAAAIISDKSILDNLSGDEWREAFRACKGMVLRQEIFALDAPLTNATPDQQKLQLTPFSVAAHNCTVQLLQPRAGNRYDVFMVTESEILSFNYERNTGDPRVTHSLNTVLDELGNVLETASIAYGRSKVNAVTAAGQISQNISSFAGNIQCQNAFAANLASASAAQQKNRISYSTSAFSKDCAPDDATYRLRMLSEIKTFELTGLSTSATLFQLTDFNDPDTAFNILQGSQTTLIAYHDAPDLSKKQRRLVEDIQTLYYSEDLSGSLPAATIASHGLSFENYQLAFTPQIITDIFGTKISDPDTTLPTGGFLHNGDLNWWIRSGTAQYISGGENLSNARSRFYSAVSITDALGTSWLVNYYKDYFLMIQSVEDNIVHNKTSADSFNFRSLSPILLRDINDNLSAVIIDELGMVKASAILGKDLDQNGIPELEICDNLTGITEITDAAESTAIQAYFQIQDSNLLATSAKNLLQHATTRFLYNFDNYTSSGKPTAAASIVREEHDSINPNPAIQCGFEYSDGLGKLAMVKKQAEPGPAKKGVVANDGTFTLTEIDTSTLNPTRLRWIGNGRTVLNNKGNPVKQYEPYFSVTPFYENADELVETGVSSIFYYDSPGRKVKTKFPDGSFSSVEYGAWKQITYDQNDNVLLSDWYLFRTDGLHNSQLSNEGLDPVKEKDAALKAAKHDHTPEQVHLDSLGRPVLSIEDNGADSAGKNQYYTLLIEMDIENNTISIVDARGNQTMRYRYDMLGHRININSPDAGERWILSNVIGLPVNKWDSRNHIFSFFYDGLHRPSHTTVAGGDGDLLINKAYTFEKFTYVEGQADDKKNNFRGKPVEHFDQAGKISFTFYDLKGNLLTSFRQLFAEYKEIPDWNGGSIPDNQQYPDQQTYDALNRVTVSRTPDGSTSFFAFNEAGLLKTITVTQSGINKPYVNNIDYNEKRQRSKIIYGNLVSTAYEYDPNTFHLIHLATQDGNSKKLQDLYYTYDPVGNITRLEDKCIPAIFFKNYLVDGISDYDYDPLYRLADASGREHLGQLNYDAADNWKDLPFLQTYNPADQMSWQNYTQSYQYDPAGNILQMKHVVGAGGWQRDYQYENGTNRLSTTQIKGSAIIYSYTYHPQHGFITGMPHLPLMQWNFKDQLLATATQKVNGGNPPTTYYVYDGAGQRIRKVTEDGNGNIINERIYLGRAEFYFEYSGGNRQLERDTLRIMDDRQCVALIESLKMENGNAVSEILVRYQFSNLLDSACLELSDATSPQVISYEEYHPFGTTSYQAMNGAVKAAYKRYRYTGLERDEETGLGYHSARYYISWLGRWTATDPKGLTGSANLYMYCSDNPIVYTDTEGTDDDDKTTAPTDKKPDYIISIENYFTKTLKLNADTEAAIAKIQAEAEAKIAELQKEIDALPFKETEPGHLELKKPSVKQELDDLANAELIAAGKNKIKLADHDDPRDPETLGFDIQSGISGVGLGKNAKFSGDYLQVTVLPRNLEIIPLYNRYDLDIALLKEPGAQYGKQTQSNKKDGTETLNTVGASVDLFNLTYDDNLEVAATTAVGYNEEHGAVSLTGSIGAKYTIWNQLPVSKVPILGRGTLKLRVFIGAGYEYDFRTRKGEDPSGPGGFNVGGGLLVEWNPFEKKKKKEESQ